tara:strand:+ start:2090 stop:4339 length:2250 start_codon:yes stop_codon:yes gene_type:complete
MAKSKKEDNPIKDHIPEPAFVTWDSNEEKAAALAAAAGAVEVYDGIGSATASHRSFLDVEGNISVRTGYQRDDYNRFRSREAIPRQQKKIMAKCMDAYDRVGIIRNVIDLMGDFATQGISIVHPNKRIERFFQKWFDKVSGKERSERFLNNLYRCGNVVVKRQNAKLSKKLEKELAKGSTSDIEILLPKVTKREIPWRYDFLNPLTVEVIGGQLAIFAGDPQLGLKVSATIKKMVLSGSEYPEIIAKLPKDLVKSIRDGNSVIPLDPDKTSIHYYKKDDWQIWANPMILSVLDDVVMLEKMKLADMSALDGAISNIRLWKLGDLDNKILPTKTGVNKLRNILASNVGGGTMDLVWGPELDFKESATEVHKFLGAEKYQPVLTSIYAGLGIPPTLTGASNSSGGGFTNNFVSLKTLIERLEYGRDLLVSFWNAEIEAVQKAMGFRFPAKIHFEQMILSDEAAEKNLLIQLVDRDLISAETVQARFGELPEIERIRIKREVKDRENEKMPQKSGPYHNPQHRNDLEKIALGKDLLEAEDLGLIPSEETGNHPFTKPEDRRDTAVVEEKKEEKKDKQDEREIKKMDQKQQSQPPQQKEFGPTGRPEDGRPKNAKDEQKRKQKRVVPKSAASDFTNLFLWANDAQKQIAEIVHPALLAHYDKKNIRSLTKSQMDELEYIKFCLLCGLTPYVELDTDVIQQLLQNSNTAANTVLSAARREFVTEFVAVNGKQPTVEEMRNIQSSAYAMRALTNL